VGHLLSTSRKGPESERIEMGAWGPGLFEGDMSADVKGMFEDVLAEGMSVAQATRHILEELGDAVDDYDDGPEISIALAALQLQHGALETGMKTRALAAIDHDLQRWEDSARTPEDYEERKAVLEEFRGVLREA
jgi:hypothetical protein